MSLLNDVVTISTKIEQLLKLLGADGVGISELLDSLGDRIGPELRKSIRLIARVRNSYVHEYGYSYPGSHAELKMIGHETVSELHHLSAQHQMDFRFNEDSSYLSEKSSLELGMIDYSPWVSVERKDNNANLFRKELQSTIERRLVIFTGSLSQVKPIGVFRRPFIFSGSGVAWVNMTPRHVTIVCEAQDVELIRLKVTVMIRAVVRDDVDSIESVARDAYHGVTSELNQFIEAVQGIVSYSFRAIRFRYGIDVNDVDQVLRKRILEIGEVFGVFKLQSLSLKSIEAIDPEVSQMSMAGSKVLMQAKIEEQRQKLNDVLGRHERERLERELHETKARNAVEAERLTQLSLREDRTLELQHRLQLEQLKARGDIDIRIAEISARSNDRTIEIYKGLLESGKDLKVNVLEAENRLLSDALSRTSVVEIRGNSSDARKISGGSSTNKKTGSMQSKNNKGQPK